MLPAHAQTSPPAAVTISDISCSFNTPILQVGSTITMEATLADEDTPVEDINWELRSNSRFTDLLLAAPLIAFGQGQFTTTTVDIIQEDADRGFITLELVAQGDLEVATEAVLCDEIVS